MKKYIKSTDDITDYRGYYIERHILSDGDSYAIYDSIDDSKVGTAFSLEQAYNLIDSWEDGTIDSSENLNLDILRKQQELYDDCIYDFARYSHIPINSISENGIIHTEYTNKMKKNGDYIRITDAYLDGLIDSFNKKSEQSKYNVYIDYRITNGGDYRLIADMV